MILQFKVAQPADVVFDYLTDMQKFVSVHPVIHQMDKLDANRYRVHETLKFGAVPFSFTYVVTLVSDAATKRVQIEASVLKMTRIRMQFQVTGHEGVSLVEEEVTFNSFLPLKTLMEKIFRQQHRQLFENMAKAE